jgi:hypothetical protein
MIILISRNRRWIILRSINIIQWIILITISIISLWRNNFFLYIISFIPQTRPILNRYFFIYFIPSLKRSIINTSFLINCLITSLYLWLCSKTLITLIIIFMVILFTCLMIIFLFQLLFLLTYIFTNSNNKWTSANNLSHSFLS